MIFVNVVHSTKKVSINIPHTYVRTTCICKNKHMYSCIHIYTCIYMHNVCVHKYMQEHINKNAKTFITLGMHIYSQTNILSYCKCIYVHKGSTYLHKQHVREITDNSYYYLITALIQIFMKFFYCMKCAFSYSHTSSAAHCTDVIQLPFTYYIYHANLQKIA